MSLKDLQKLADDSKKILTPHERFLQGLEVMAQSMDTSASLEEIVKLITDLIEFAQKNEQYLSTGFENLRSMFNEAVKETKSINNDNFLTLKSRLMSYCEDEMSKMAKSHQEIMKKHEQKMSEVLDGKDADEEKIIQAVIDQLPPPEPKETAKETANRLNTEKEIIEQETIKGLIKRFEDLEDKISKAKGTTNIIGGAIGGGHTAKVHDLTDSLNGVTKTFALPAFWRVLNVYSTSSPVIFRPTIDYTVDGSAMTITFTSEINESTTLSVGQTLLVLYSE